MLIDTWFPFVGGGQVHVKNLSKSLKSKNVKITLFHSPHHNIFIRTFWNLFVIPQVILAHKSNRFDLIHAHAFSAAVPLKVLSTLLRLPSIFTVHGSHLMDTKAKGVKPYLEKILLTKIRFTHQISVNKTFTKYPNVNKNISVIPNGVDIKAFNKVNVTKNKQFTLLYVGRIHPTKGINYLQDAMVKVHQKYPQINLKLIIGQYQGRQLIKQYKKAHGFILPSLAEGQPLTLVEAWAAHLPVIATKTSGVKEIAANNKDAILIEPASTKQLIKAIIKLYLMKPQQTKTLTQNGYSKAEELSWDKIALQTLNVYKQCLKN